MGKVLKGVLVGVTIIVICFLLAGLTTIVPSWVADWLPLIGLLIGCIAITLVGRLRLFYALIITLAIYLCVIILITLIDLLWADVSFGPLQLGAIPSAWAANQAQIHSWIPLLQLLEELAVFTSNFVSETIIHNILFNLVTYSFYALLSLVLAALASLVKRQAPMVTPVPSDIPGAQPMESKMPRTTAPSAKAMAEVRGKPTKKLKSVDQNAPRGQSRCPHCNATVIVGSHYCNACQREF